MNRSNVDGNVPVEFLREKSFKRYGAETVQAIADAAVQRAGKAEARTVHMLLPVPVPNRRNSRNCYRIALDDIHQS